MPAGLAAPEICTALAKLTSKSESCQGPAKQLTIVTTALAISGFGPIPAIIDRLTDIIQLCGTFVSQLNGTQPFTTKTDEDAIMTSLTSFVKAHQQLLNILIEKAAIAPNLMPYVGPPLATAMRNLETAVDTCCFELIDRVPDCKTEATKQKDSLDFTLADAIKNWSSQSQLGVVA